MTLVTKVVKKLCDYVALVYTRKCLKYERMFIHHRVKEVAARRYYSK